MNIIELKNITFSYENGEPPVLENFSLFVGGGECVVIHGDNGSGKTTLFRILNGLSFPQSGSYQFEGITIDAKYLRDSRQAKNFHKRIGYLFQNVDVMLFNGTVYDEIAFGPRQMGLDDKEVDEKTSDCLKLLQIEQLAGKAPYHLSGGQKKKVALAAVVALNPDILILDEPFAGLDKTSCMWLGDFLKELKQAGKTIIMATHEEMKLGVKADKIITLTT